MWCYSMKDCYLHACTALLLPSCLLMIFVTYTQGACDQFRSESTLFTPPYVLQQHHCIDYTNPTIRLLFATFFVRSAWQSLPIPHTSHVSLFPSDQSASPKRPHNAFVNPIHLNKKQTTVHICTSVFELHTPLTRPTQDTVTNSTHIDLLFKPR
jgi:hypothetical protein